MIHERVGIFAEKYPGGEIMTDFFEYSGIGGEFALGRRTAIYRGRLPEFGGIPAEVRWEEPVP